MNRKSFCNFSLKEHRRFGAIIKYIENTNNTTNLNNDIRD